MYSRIFCGGIVILLSGLAVQANRAEDVDDPLAAIFDGQLDATVDVTLRRYRSERQYNDAMFPLTADHFADFRRQVTSRFVDTLGLRDWQVGNPMGKASPIATRFVAHPLKTIRHHGVVMQAHVIEIPEIGLRVPVVICVPDDSDTQASGTSRLYPGVCVFSGHSRHGLRDLVHDLDSYQSGIAVRPGTCWVSRRLPSRRSTPDICHATVPMATTKSRSPHLGFIGAN